VTTFSNVRACKTYKQKGKWFALVNSFLPHIVCINEDDEKKTNYKTANRKIILRNIL
jgi:hypothetical protein